MPLLCWGLPEPPPRERESGSESQRWGVCLGARTWRAEGSGPRLRGSRVRPPGGWNRACPVGALCWAESRTREGSAEERKPEAGGAGGGARGKGSPERIGWGGACGFSRVNGRGFSETKGAGSGVVRGAWVRLVTVWRLEGQRDGTPRWGVRGGWVGGGAETQDRRDQGNTDSPLDVMGPDLKRAGTQEGARPGPCRRGRRGLRIQHAREVLATSTGETREGTTSLTWCRDLKVALVPRPPTGKGETQRGSLLHPLLLNLEVILVRDQMRRVWV